MPGIQRRGKKTVGPPLKRSLRAAVLPYFRSTLAFQNTDHLLIEMFLRFKGAPTRDLGHIQA